MSQNVENSRRSTMSSFRRGILATTAIVCASFVLTGCGVTPVPPVSVEKPDRAEAVNFMNEAPITTLYGDALSTWETEYDHGKPLPKTLVGPVRGKKVPLMEALGAYGGAAGISVVSESSLDNKTLNILDVKERPFDQLMDAIADHANVFYHYDGSTLNLYDTREFFYRVPMLEGFSSSIIAAIEGVGATNVNIEPLTGLLSFTADYQTFQKVSKYMKTVDQGRDMLVYDVWLMEVNLNNDQGFGIDWGSALNLLDDTLSIGTSIASATTAQLGGFSIDMTSSRGSGDINSVLNMISSNGNTKTIARPEVTFISGGSAKFDIGEEQEYIAQVSEHTDGDDDSNDSEITVDTETLKTGTLVELSGSHTNGVIHTKVNIDLNTLIKFQEFSTGTGDDSEKTSLSLPHTAFRKMETTVDARPGDVLVIGGLIQETRSDTGEEIYGTGIPTLDQKGFERTETIMMLRPRLVKIRPGQEGKFNTVETTWLNKLPTGEVVAVNSPEKLPEPDTKTPTGEATSEKASENKE